MVPSSSESVFDLRGEDRSPLLVLVAEGETTLRHALAEALRTDNCEAIEVPDAAALMSALTDVHRVRDPQLLIVDLDLLEGDGRNLLGRVLDAAPGIARIFTTRSSDHRVRTRAMATGGLLFDKPFPVADLAASARWVLRTSAALRARAVPRNREGAPGAGRL